MTPTQPVLLTVRQQLDWERFPAVVFESDDWGACELSRDADDAAALAELWGSLHGNPGPVDCTLESVAQLDQLYELLAQYRGADGLPAVFTAFAITGNPNYAAMRANGFSRYVDIGVDQGFPGRWQRPGLIAKWREGIARGVWAPEFHSNLHHTSPIRWLERLRADGPEGAAARAAFDRESYYQGVHLPEFDGMNVRRQHAWIKTGIARFVKAVGYRPAAAVTSDAYPVTETVWSILGIRTVCLKNLRNNRGEIVIYHTKPWNNQDYYAPMGAYEPMQDLVYLSRNVLFEDQGEEEALCAIRACWGRLEPAIVSTHRRHYTSLDDARRRRGFAKLHALLGQLAADRVRYLTTAEVGDLYRRGWSMRRFGNQCLVRQYTTRTLELVLPGSVTRVTPLPEGRDLPLTHRDNRTHVTVPGGEYRVDLMPAAG